MENFAELLNSYLPGEQKTGDTTNGILLRKEAEFAFLNINNKLEGRIKLSEVEDLNIGDSISVLVIKKEEDFFIVSKKALEIRETFKNTNKGDIVKGKIVKRDKSGYIVNLGNINAILPFRFSALSQNHTINDDIFEFEVVDKNIKNKTIYLSRVNIVKKEEEKIFDSLSLNQIIEAKIHNITEFGLIINFGVLNGLVHLSELSWDKNIKLKNFKVGDLVKVKVIEIDKENKKIRLSIKQTTENPWIAKKEKYKIGQNFDAKIKEIFNFGVIVDLGNDEGFIHISDLFYKKLGVIEKEFKKGDIVFCEIISFDDEKERINLSSKVLFEKIWLDIEHIHFVNDTVNVEVIRVKDFGIFTKTVDNIEIFVPKSEFSWNKNEKLNLKEGDKIDIKIIEIEKEEKNIVGSIRKLGISPFEVASSKYNLKEEYEVKVSDIIENGLLVKLTDDFKGLIPKKEISKEEIKDLKDKFKVGDLIKAIVFEKNENKNSILLSIKKIEEIEEEKEFKKLMEEYGV